MNLDWIRDQHLFIDYQCFNFRPFESNLDCLSNYYKTERIRLPQLPFQRFPPTQIIAYIERNSAKWTDWKGIVSIYDEACPSASKQDLRMPLENRQSLRLDQDFESLDAVHDNHDCYWKTWRGAEKIGLTGNVAVSKSARNQGIGQSLRRKFEFAGILEMLIEKFGA